MNHQPAFLNNKKRIGGGIVLKRTSAFKLGSLLLPLVSVNSLLALVRKLGLATLSQILTDLSMQFALQTAKLKLLGVLATFHCERR